MAIIIDKNEKLFTLHTVHSTYQMKADYLGTLLHLYYGKRTDDSDKSYILSYRAEAFPGIPMRWERKSRRIRLMCCLRSTVAMALGIIG